MKRTTVFLPAELKSELESMARSEGCSEAELIRDGVRRAIEARRPRPRPDFPLFSSGKLRARDVDTHLAGDPEHGVPAFGED